MKKRQLLGIIMMVVAIGISAYVGGWQLLIRPIINVCNVFNSKTIVITIFKVCVLFPMLMSVMLPLLELGRMFFLDKKDF